MLQKQWRSNSTLHIWNRIEREVEMLFTSCIINQNVAFWPVPFDFWRGILDLDQWEKATSFSIAWQIHIQKPSYATWMEKWGRHCYSPHGGSAAVPITASHCPKPQWMVTVNEFIPTSFVWEKCIHWKRERLREIIQTRVNNNSKTCCYLDIWWWNVMVF